MPPTKHLAMIVMIILTSCHQAEQPAPRRLTRTGNQTLLIDSAHPFYPYVDSSLPFAMPKERVTIYEITIHHIPALYPAYYGIELKGKGWMGHGDSLPMVIDSPVINWPHPPREPSEYHF